MKKIRNKITAILMTLVLLTGLIVITGTAETYAAGTSYKLPTKVTTYKYENGKWKKQNSYTYKYDEKGNIINWDGTKLRNSYKNGKLKEVSISGINKEMFDGIPYWTTKTYNSKGRIKRLDYDDDNMNIAFDYYYNSKGYIKKRVNVYNEDYVTSYKFKYFKNGMPKQITETEDSSKIVEKFTSKGLPESGKVYKKGKLKDTWTNKITTSKGKVTKVIETHKVGKKVTDKWKYIYTYGTAKTTNKKTYAAIMGMTQGSIIFRTIGDNSAVGWCSYTYEP